MSTGTDSSLSRVIGQNERGLRLGRSLASRSWAQQIHLSVGDKVLAQIAFSWRAVVVEERLAEDKVVVNCRNLTGMGYCSAMIIVQYDNIAIENPRHCGGSLVWESLRYANGATIALLVFAVTNELRKDLCEKVERQIG